MTFLASIKTCLYKKYACFHGRASLSEYWYFAFSSIIFINIVKHLVPSLELLLSLILSIPSLAVSVRRLHDSNLSAWWVLVLFAPSITLGEFDFIPVSKGILIIGVLPAIGIALYLLMRESSPGENRFGFPESSCQENEQTDSHLSPPKQTTIILEKTKTCPECGQQQSPSANFCSNCGTRFNSQKSL